MPKLFTIVVKLAALKLKAEFKKNNIKILNSYVSTDKINTTIKKLQKSNILHMSKTTILTLLCVNDGIIPFSSREETIKGSELDLSTFLKFRLIVYTGTEKKISKTKSMFIPSTKKLN